MDGVGIVNNVLLPQDFNRLLIHFKNNPILDSIGTDEFGRKLLNDKSEPILKEFAEILLPKVREYFGTDTALSSYSLFAEYSDKQISLHKHKDANACTYTLDLVLYQKSPWALYIEGQTYIAKPNEAIMFMGEKYEHWRDTLYTNSDKIGVVFFHYVEPNHWYFTKGPEHIQEIWKARRGVGDQ